MKIEQTTTLDRFIQMLSLAPGAIMAEVDQVVQRVAIMGARDAKRDAPKSLSELTNSIRNERLGVAFARIVATAGHAGYVERGSRPGGAPPIEALRRWIRLAQIRPRAATDERGLAFLIQRKIRREGTPAQPFMAPQAETSRARLMALIPVAVGRANREVFG